MALDHSPRLVTDGLVLCLDAANKKSYSETSVWTDITYTGNDGAISATGVTFDPANMGVLTFDGASGVVDCGNDDSINFGTGGFTISIWFLRHQTETTNNERLLSKAGASDAVQPSASGFAIYGSNSSLSFTVNASAPRVTVSAGSITPDVWTNVTCVLDRSGTMRAFKNTVMVGVAPSPTGSVTGTSPLLIGRNTSVDRFWPGKIACVHMYNRALTQAEINQNYNSLKGRFGL